MHPPPSRNHTDVLITSLWEPMHRPVGRHARRVKKKREEMDIEGCAQGLEASENKRIFSSLAHKMQGIGVRGSIDYRKSLGPPSREANRLRCHGYGGKSRIHLGAARLYSSSGVWDTHCPPCSTKHCKWSLQGSQRSDRDILENRWRSADNRNHTKSSTCSVVFLLMRVSFSFLLFCSLVYGEQLSI